jgi:hypothetical protein
VRIGFHHDELTGMTLVHTKTLDRDDEADTDHHHRAIEVVLSKVVAAELLHDVQGSAGTRGPA